jgi:hypothetical protein
VDIIGSSTARVTAADRDGGELGGAGKAKWRGMSRKIKFKIV